MTQHDLPVDEYSDLRVASPLSNRVMIRVRSEILSGRARPGMMYSVPALSEKYGVSTTPIREALIDLSRAGLLIPKRNRGFEVAGMTLEELNQLFELRELLERHAVEVLARKRKNDGTALYKLADAVAAAVNANDAMGYIEADRAFHEQLLTAAGNPRLTQSAMEMRDIMRLYGIDTELGRQRQLDSVQEHRQLVDLAIAGKAKAAGDLISRHILDWQPIFTAALSAKPESNGRA